MRPGSRASAANSLNEPLRWWPPAVAASWRGLPGAGPAAAPSASWLPYAGTPRSGTDVDANRLMGMSATPLLVWVGQAPGALALWVRGCWRVAPAVCGSGRLTCRVADHSVLVAHPFFSQQ